MAGVKNVGGGAVEAILETRQEAGAFTSLYDFCERIDSRRVNRRVVESLVRCGAFDCFKATRASLWQALPAALERGQSAQRDRASGQGSLFADVGATEPTLPEVPEWPASERLSGEKEILGFYVTGHPLQEHRDELERFASVTSDALAEHPRGQPLRMVGVITQLRTLKTRAGDMMARAVIEDLTGTADVVVFPKVFDRYSELLRAGDPVLARGSLGTQGDRAELQLDEVMPLENVWRDAVRELELRIEVERAARPRLEQLREILDLSPGEVPVSVRLLLPEGVEALLELTRHRVAVSADLVGRLDALFGAKVAECTL
jgi:DNA polymerase-3 subunit alpha